MTQSIKNEKGVTLIELISSIAILTIILLSFMSFFIMSAKYNGVSSDKMNATNIAREVQEEFKVNEEKNLALKNLINYSRTSSVTSIPKSSYPNLNLTQDIQINNDILTLIFTKQNFTIKVNVDTSSDENIDISLSKINVQVINGTNVLSETFTYFEN
ncbi:type IV pilus modification PilV family protein [Bacillus sp. JJ1562]|uniref:type IV pilus modification PilV family protein n=1 Tax=Bacillus sp. JJ1562 TaxID=3122960 RepID=UPI0030021DFE